MKLTLTLLLTIFCINTYAQETQKLEFCNCTDKIEQISPVLNGKYERICNDKINETGAFKNGKKDGEWITYSKKGTVIKKLSYDEGKLNGSVELLFFNGKTKFKGAFTKGKQNGEWIYYNSNGKTLMQGEYDNGKPIKTWTINKGSKAIIQYDFNSSNYLLNGKPDLRKSGFFMRNDNTGEYFFYYFSPEQFIAETAPLGGHRFAQNLLLDLFEIPLDYWDTYVAYDYKAKVTLTPDHQSNFVIALSNEEYDFEKEATYPFVIKTNPDSKIKKVDHTELSKQLLGFKIDEAFSLLPPWIYAGKTEIDIHIPYVVNRLIDFSKPAERKYN